MSLSIGQEIFVLPKLFQYTADQNIFRCSKIWNFQELSGSRRQPLTVQLQCEYDVPACSIAGELGRYYGGDAPMQTELSDTDSPRGSFCERHSFPPTQNRPE